ncbi:phosphonate ABC transporter, permease protein PhnE [Sandaracinobacteroides saxicola]|uniref:Phosphonate ABC transporter, permease protein PhnE n=1 Tax=Sandaracinobacteroides saxicola TaxID=2759707 RepID=A0A7G5IL65_9SPHN|nr:phosphonate ABC transporter, permease protein PhnE [Sandaracinobacteroides saxicola]QMW24107.1 phosphonate ABC transporter, permease protein PhnE [Sandaracinobacteroides saxicola]
MPETGAIRVEGLCHRWADGGEALRDIDLCVPQGSHVVIEGPSGSGKSTLLRLLAGGMEPTAGRVLIEGRVARIHQDLRLVGRASALANVLHGALGRLSFAQSLRWPAVERARAEALLARVGLGHRMAAPARTLSGGEAQRVAIARALMQEPDVLLADEPVAALDPANAEAIMTLLGELQRERGLTLLTVLHDAALARRHGDRVVRLEAGRAHVAATVDDAGARGAGPVALPVEPAEAGRRDGRWVALGVFVALILASLPVLAQQETRLTGAFAAAAGFLTQLWPAAEEMWTIEWRALLRSLLATVQMAVLGTVMAVGLALPLAALAARNLMPGWVRLPLRAGLNLWRAVPSIIWALLFVAAVGLGAVAGVVALTAYSIGYLTKFFYEAFEGVDGAAPGALAELGASGAQRFVHAVWPLALPGLVGSCLFMLEYNVRAASVLGLVGAGGIGQDLKLAVDWANWHVVGVILVMLAGAVIAVDALSARVRGALG